MERIRGSSEVPLSEDGLRKAHEVGMQLAQKGGLHRIVTSNLGRTVTTARAIARYTRAPITDVTNSLHPWHLGEMEGQKVTDGIINRMNDLVVNRPDVAPPGRGPDSTADGESFNNFKNRALPYIDNLVRQKRGNANEKTGVVTHYRVKKLVESWLNRGGHADYEIDPQEMVQHYGGDKPGSVDRLSWDQNVGLQLNPVDLNSASHLMGGIYLIRHAPTQWNEGTQTSAAMS